MRISDWSSDVCSSDLFGLRGEDAPRLLSILFRTATLTSESGIAARAALADRYLRMPVSRIGLFDWKRMDEIIDRAYQYALSELAPADRKSTRLNSSH